MLQLFPLSQGCIQYLDMDPKHLGLVLAITDFIFSIVSLDTYIISDEGICFVKWDGSL